MIQRTPEYHRARNLRGAALVTCGVGWIIYGYGILGVPRVALNKATEILTSIVPLDCWGYIWMMCGAIAILGSFLRPALDFIAFAAAALPPASWAVAFNAAWISGGYPQAWTAIPAWSVPLVLLYVIAALSAQLTALLRRIKALEEGLNRGHH